MYIVNGLMVVVTILLYLIYKKISSMLILLENESKYVQDYGEFNNRLGIKDWLYLIFKRTADSYENLTNIDYTLNCDNPAGSNSARSKRIQNLTKLYTDYLIENEQLSQCDAEAKAAFEFAKFDNDELIKAINRDSRPADWHKRFAKERSIERNFWDTGILEKDCIAQAQNLIPHDVFAPVWVLFKKHMYTKDEQHPLEIDKYENSYSDYVKNRGIILNLINHGIIERVEPESPDRYWLIKPLFKFTIYDLEEIRSILYMGKSSHDDDYFESTYREGRLIGLFKPKFW